jgi:hypothetical protein
LYVTDPITFEDELDFQELLREFIIGTVEGHQYAQDIVINGTLLGEFQITVKKKK